MTRWPAASKRDREGHRARLGVHDRRGTRAGRTDPTPNTSMSLPLAFVVTISFEPSGEKATWPGCVDELGRGGRVETQGAVRSREREEVAEEAHEALDGAPVLGVEDVDEIAVDGDADRERPARIHHLAQGEAVAAHREDGHRVAAGVDGIEQRCSAGRRSAIPARPGGRRPSRSTARRARRCCRCRPSDRVPPGAGRRRRPGCRPCCRSGRRRRCRHRRRTKDPARSRLPPQAVPRGSTVPASHQHRQPDGRISSLHLLSVR